MSAKAQVKTQAKRPAAPAAARIPQPLVPEPEHVPERPAIAAQLEGAARLGHSLGAVGVDGPAPSIIQRQEMPEEEEEELQLKREPAAVQRQELPEEEEEEWMLKPEEGRVGPQGGPVPPAVEAAIHRARGGGQPLECALQAQMSARLAHDFSRVRVHTDAEADHLNQQLQAKAFTTGADIFFKRGAYEPGTSTGRELIAHELSHVVQQSTGRVSAGVGGSAFAIRPAGDAFEQEADVLARQAARTWSSPQPRTQRRRWRQRQGGLSEPPRRDSFDRRKDGSRAVAKGVSRAGSTAWHQTWSTGAGMDGAGSLNNPLGAAGTQSARSALGSTSAIQRKITSFGLDIGGVIRQGRTLVRPVRLRVGHNSGSGDNIDVKRETRALFTKVDPWIIPGSTEYRVTDGRGINTGTAYRHALYTLEDAKWQVDGPDEKNVIRDRVGRVLVDDAPGFTNLWDEMRPAALEAEYKVYATDLADGDTEEFSYPIKFGPV